MATAAPNSLVFRVDRKEPELIKPAKPTPHEFKYLSDIDDQKGLWFHIPAMQFYRYSPKMRGKDPVKTIRDAIAETLVFYYPFAGRLRIGPDQKLIVECTGEGLLFIEADAQVTLEQFGDELHPPFPCAEELLFDVPGSSEILDQPLVLIQVTRLKCGGFIVASRFNHTMADALGIIKFFNTIAEMAQGARALSVPPVWKRSLLSATDPPLVRFTHREYEEAHIISMGEFESRPFFFGPKEMSTLRNLLPPHLSQCSSFELLAACLWKCRTIALQPDPMEEMRFMCLINAREKINPPLPTGYYGNCFGLALALATAGDLSQKPLEFALELVMKAKANVTHEYMQSVAALMVLKGRPRFTMHNAYVVSDVRYAGIERVNYGWGNAMYGSIARSSVGPNPGASNFFIPFTNKNGENGVVVVINLPLGAMDIFVKALDNLLEGKPRGQNAFKLIKSSL